MTGREIRDSNDTVPPIQPIRLSRKTGFRQ